MLMDSWSRNAASRLTAAAVAVHSLHLIATDLVLVLLRGRG